MASAHDIYKALFAGSKLTIGFSSRKEFDCLRVAIQRYHKIPKDLEVTNDSVCASYDAATGLGTFWLGVRKRPSRTDFQIVSQENPDADL